MLTRLPRAAMPMTQRMLQRRAELFALNRVLSDWSDRMISAFIARQLAALGARASPWRCGVPSCAAQNYQSAVLCLRCANERGALSDCRVHWRPQDPPPDPPPHGGGPMGHNWGGVSQSYT